MRSPRRHIRLIGVLSTGAAIAGMCAPGAAVGSGTGALAGKVMSNLGLGITQPLSGASVQCDNHDGARRAIYRTTTGQDGAYAIAEVLEDDYYCTASAPGHHGQGKDVVVTAGETTLADFKLYKPPPSVPLPPIPLCLHPYCTSPIGG